LTVAADTLPIAFRPLTAEDFPRLQHWLMQPHVREFYQKAEISLDEVEAKYGPRVRGEAPTICHIATYRGEPFAYLQCYRNTDWPDWAEQIAHLDGLSIDLYIGDPTYHRRGFGRAMLAAYLRDVAFVAFADQDSAFIAHEQANLGALRCSEAVGFQPVGPFVEDGEPMMLLRLARDMISGA
jgi:aminoglycoside 6'-N-acetyltransferase